jgi:hypothetical protein
VILYPFMLLPSRRSTGLVLYELFTGRPFFSEAVTYSTVAALTADGAGAEAVRQRVRQHCLDSVAGPSACA